jgi:hypothetical protein
MRLQLFTPPVRTDCEFDSAFYDWRVMSDAGRFAAVSASGEVLLLTISGTSFEVDSLSLTPTDASLIFDLPATSLHWRVDSVVQEVRDKGHDPGPIPCGNCTMFGWKQYFTDGECRQFGTNPGKQYQLRWPREPHMQGLTASQKAVPQVASVQLQPGIERVRVAFLSQQLQKDNGSPLEMVADRAFQGNPELRFSFRSGWTYKNDPNWEGGGFANPDKGAVKIEERHFVKDLRIIRPTAYTPIFAGSATGAPPPLRISQMPSCTQAISASWRENRLPIITVGGIPGIGDVSSGYGAPP